MTIYAKAPKAIAKVAQNPNDMDALIAHLGTYDTNATERATITRMGAMAKPDGFTRLTCLQSALIYLMAISLSLRAHH